MTPADDGTGEMRTFPFGDSTADALLDGMVAPDDAPPGLERVAALVHAARSPATIRELADEARVVAAVAASVRGRANMPEGGRRRRRMFGQLVSAKVIAAAAVALAGSAAAAAAGSLPSPVQSAVSTGLSHVGISVPNPDSHPGTGDSTAPGTTGSSGTTTGPSGTPGPAITTANEYGLCTAYAASQAGTSTNSHSVGATDGSRAFAALRAAATAKGETVSQFCTGVTPSGTSGSSGVPASSTNAGDLPVTIPGGNTPGRAPSINPAGKAPGSGNVQAPDSTPSTSSTGSTPVGSAVTTPAGNTPGSPPASVRGSSSSHGAH